ncbi:MULTISPECIES: hypothetical protein [Halorussus]|nr:MULTISPECIES: hypothetical protein [Halorussus]
MTAGPLTPWSVVAVVGWLVCVVVVWVLFYAYGRSQKRGSRY